MKYPMHVHSPESLQLAVVKAFDGALPIANEHGVGLVVVGGISTHGPGGGGGSGPSSATGGNASGGAYPPGCGPVSQADRDSLYRSGIILGGAVYSVVSDPPGAGGEGRTGSGGGMSASSPSNPPGAGEGRTWDGLLEGQAYEGGVES